MTQLKPIPTRKINNLNDLGNLALGDRINVEILGTGIDSTMVYEGKIDSKCSFIYAIDNETIRGYRSHPNRILVDNGGIIIFPVFTSSFEYNSPNKSYQTALKLITKSGENE